MYKSLNTVSLGVSGRQSELIELALTYSFRGLDVDIADLQKRGLDASKRFLGSTNLALNFELPTSLAGDDAEFKKQLEQLETAAALAAQLGAKVCTTAIQPASEEHPFHANFELHRRRLGEVAEVLAKNGIKLAVGLLAAEPHRTGKYYQFISQPEQALMLLQAVNSTNIQLLLDTWNWTVSGGTVEQIKNLKAGQVGAVRLADVPASFDSATITEEERRLPEEGGVIDFVAVLQHLAEIGFDGPLAVCPHPKQCIGTRRDALVQRVGGVLDEKLKAAGILATEKLAPAAAGR